MSATDDGMDLIAQLAHEQELRTDTGDSVDRDLAWIREAAIIIERLAKDPADASAQTDARALLKRR